MSIGYCCLNMSLKDSGVKINRGMIKKTFDNMGLNYVSDLISLNLSDTLEILKWNNMNKIYVYRMSSDSFPWMLEYEFSDLPNFEKIKKRLEEIGDYIKNNNIRVSYHPSQFNVLGSLDENVVNRTIKELDKHSELMDLMKLEQSTFYPINIHINNTKPNIIESSSRFCSNFDKLSNGTKLRLTVENDDSENKFSVSDLYENIFKKINIPIVFDQHHFNIGKKDQSIEEAFLMSYSTWKTKPITHMSSSRKIEDVNSRKNAHADYIYERIETFGFDFDTEIEAKLKDIAVLKYFKDFE